MVAACGGALAASALDGRGTTGALGAVAAAGFLALVAVPALVVASAAVRGLWAAWRPDELGERMIEDGGGAPRLAGWAIVIWLGALVLAWTVFESTVLLATWTAFKPTPVSFAEPVVAVVAALVLVAVSRPAVTGVAALVRRVDARWRRRGRRSLVMPARVAIAAAAASIAVAYALWRLVARPQLGPLELELLRAPAAGLATAGIVHAVWRKLPRARRVVGPALVAGAAIAIGVALFASRARPALALAVWGDRPAAGLAIDLLFDLDTIRDRLPLADLAPVARAGAVHPDIVLVTIDTVRADHTPPYGGRAEMPALRELAERGTVFEWAFSPSNVTRRSIPSMITGLAPNRVRGRVIGWALRVDPRHVMVAERLAAAGYDTAGFMCCAGIWGSEFKTGLQRGLHHLEIEPRENGVALAHMGRTWIDARDRAGATRPLFVWMHLIEPHNWQQFGGEPRGDDDRRHAYDRALQASDAMLAELLAGFAHRPPERMPIVIVSADHGEGLGDHGQPNHSTDLYDSQIRVPLVIAGPGIGRRRVVDTVSLTDLTPTLVELAGFEPPAGVAIDGASFADLATGRADSRADGGVAFAAMIKDRSNPGGVAAVVKGRWKLVDSGGVPELYDVRADPDEHSNLFGVKPAIVDDLRRLLKRAVDAGDVSPFE